MCLGEVQLNGSNYERTSANGRLLINTRVCVGHFIQVQFQLSAQDHLSQSLFDKSTLC